MKYIAYFDAQGERVTSYAEGVNFMPGEEEAATKKGYTDNPTATTHLLLEAEQHESLVNDDLVLLDGKLEPRPPYVPTEAEESIDEVSEIIEDHTEEINALKSALVTAMLTGDTEEQENIKRQYLELTKGADNDDDGNDGERTDSGDDDNGESE